MRTQSQRQNAWPANAVLADVIQQHMYTHTHTYIHEHISRSHVVSNQGPTFWLPLVLLSARLTVIAAVNVLRVRL